MYGNLEPQTPIRARFASSLLYIGIVMTLVVSLASLLVSIESYKNSLRSTHLIENNGNNVALDGNMKKKTDTTTEAPTGTTSRTWTPRPNDPSICDDVDYRDKTLKCKLYN